MKHRKITLREFGTYYWIQVSDQNDRKLFVKISSWMPTRLAFPIERFPASAMDPVSQSRSCIVVVPIFYTDIVHVHFNTPFEVPVVINMSTRHCIGRWCTHVLTQSIQPQTLHEFAPGGDLQLLSFEYVSLHLHQCYDIACSWLTCEWSHVFFPF
jgi:hypothetical protein